MTTPTELITKIRTTNNVVGDNFFGDTELLDYVFDAHTRLATECYIIERTQTTTTVDGTQEYSLPARYFSIKRVEYDGKKLGPIDFDLDDEETSFDSDTTSKGTPYFYYEWNNSIFLRPIPDSAKTLKIFCYMKPQDLVITSTFEISEEYNASVVDYVTAQIAQKENNFERASYFSNRWEASIQKILAKKRMRRRGDRFAAVKDEDSSLRRSLGV